MPRCSLSKEQRAPRLVAVGRGVTDAVVPGRPGWPSCEQVRRHVLGEGKKVTPCGAGRQMLVVRHTVSTRVNVNVGFFKFLFISSTVGSVGNSWFSPSAAVTHQQPRNVYVHVDVHTCLPTVTPPLCSVLYKTKRRWARTLR